MTTSIVIADDHKIVRQGLKQFLAFAPDLIVTGEAANSTELMDAMARMACDVVLLDLTMPGLSGIELIKKIVQMASPPASSC